MSQEPNAQVLERGNLYFLYRPKVDREDVKKLEDVQRFYLVLSPHGKACYRLIPIGQKQLPDVHDTGERYWGFVDRVTESATEMREELVESTYHTKTRGDRTQPTTRPAGEAVYAIARHGDHTHLLYALELPEEPGPVQQALNIEPEGSYILSVKNPDKPAPQGVGLSESQQVNFPKALQERFRGRRFSAVDPTDFLDYEGAELLLIGATDDIREELDLDLSPHHEELNTAEIFNDLRLRKSRHPLEPLLEGEWR